MKKGCLLGSSWDSFQVEQRRRRGPRRGKEAASQASHPRRRPAKPLDSWAHFARLHQSAAAYVTATRPWAVRLLHFGRSTPVGLSAPTTCITAITAARRVSSLCPIADDAISCNLLRPARCGPLAHFSPFPRGTAVFQLFHLSHLFQVSSHRLNIATFFPAAGLLSAEPAALARSITKPCTFP
jgi:hypothetical protein